MVGAQIFSSIGTSHEDLRSRWALLAIAIVLSALGAIFVWEIAQHRDSNDAQFVVHVVNVTIGITIAFVLSRTRFQWSTSNALIITIAFTAVLMAVAVGQRLGLATLNSGRVSQASSGPASMAFLSPLTQLFLPMSTALILCGGRNAAIRYSRYLLALLLACVWATLLRVTTGQSPILGYVVVVTLMAWLGGLSRKHIVRTLIGIWVLALVVLLLVGPERRVRMTHFADEKWQNFHDPLHITHAVASVARGGIFGVGIGNAAPATYALPAADGRNLFTIVGQELGLVGGSLMILLFLLMLFLGLRIAEATPVLRTRLAISGITLTLTLQAFHHIAFNSGLSAAIGPSLPFLNADAPNIMFSWAAIGLLLSTVERNRPAEIEVSGEIVRGRRLPIWYSRRRIAVQSFFVVYALLLITRLFVLATNDRLKLNYRDGFEERAVSNIVHPGD